MTDMRYSEATDLIENVNSYFKTSFVEENGVRYFVVRVGNSGTVLTVDTNHQYIMNSDFDITTITNGTDMEPIFDIAYRLASTPITKR